jgi:hypothetical protein
MFVVFERIALRFSREAHHPIRTDLAPGESAS